MKTIVILFTFAPLCLFAQQKNGFVDENGWKQGVHIGSSGSWMFERTYVIDTLTGPFRKYSQNGTTWEIGYFKNKAYDSLWISYFGDGSTESVKNYKEGKKQGEFKTYYKNGKLKYEAIFDADTLLGNASNYYESGELESRGNRRNGTLNTYYENNQIKRIEHYKDGLLTGEVELFSETGEQILPAFILEKKVDSSVINQTDLKVSILYETDQSNRRLFFGESLFAGIRVCNNTDELVLSCGAAILVLQFNGVILHQTHEIACYRELKTVNYGTNRIVEELPNDEWNVSYQKENIDHTTSFGLLTVSVRDAKCDDTGTNPISLNYHGQILEINDLDNLQFFEFDIDHDGRNELYILSYASCRGYLKVYKIQR